MREKTYLLAIALTGICAAPHGALASTGGDPKSDFEARYAQLNTAEEARDAKAIKALLAPKFQSIDVRGEASDADEMIDDLGHFPADANRKTTTTLKAVTVTGDAAVVQQSRDIRLSHPGMDGAAHAMEIITQSDDNWVQSSGGWLLAKTTATEITLIRDGAVMRHMAKGDK